MNEVQAGVDAVVNDFLTVDLVLVVQILVKSGLDILNDWSPTRGMSEGREKREERNANLSSLFTKSPKPGVSTTVKRRRTPFSSMSVTSESIITRWAALLASKTNLH